MPVVSKGAEQPFSFFYADYLFVLKLVRTNKVAHYTEVSPITLSCKSIVSL